MYYASSLQKIKRIEFTASVKIKFQEFIPSTNRISNLLDYTNTVPFHLILSNILKFKHAIRTNKNNLLFKLI